MRILIVESVRSATFETIALLQKASFAVDCAEDTEDGVEMAGIYDYDLVLIDGGANATFQAASLRALRAAVATPILVLSDASGVEAKVDAFRLGADDYVAKPFHKDELVARINAIVRRSKGHAQSVITVGELAVNLDSKMASVDGQPLALTGKEYAMLELLAMRAGSTLTKEMFLNHLYGGMDEPELKIIDVFMCKLRKKIAAFSSTNFIETVWGRGYVLKVVEADRKAA